jgi:AraC-like DNA-binding protein
MKYIGITMIFVLLLFTILLFHKGGRRYSNKILGFYLISQIIGVSNNLLFSFKQELMPDYVHCFMIGYPVVFLWLPLYYLFIRSLLDEDFRIGKREAKHFIIFFLVAVYISSEFILKDAQTKITMLSEPIRLSNQFRILNKIIIAQILVYNFATFLQYLRYRKNIKCDIILPVHGGIKWLNLVLFGFMLASLFVAFGQIIESANLFPQVDWILPGFVIFLLFFSILFYTAIVNPEILLLTEKQPKYSYSKLSGKELGEILERATVHILENESFKKLKYSLTDLANETGIRERHISQAINEIRNQNFIDFINGFRVGYAKKFLIEEGHRDKTILYILYEAGFNSKTTFNVVFKKHTGQTPSNFRKSSLLEKSSS